MSYPSTLFKETMEQVRTEISKLNQSVITLDGTIAALSTATRNMKSTDLTPVLHQTQIIVGLVTAIGNLVESIGELRKLARTRAKSYENHKFTSVDIGTSEGTTNLKSDVFLNITPEEIIVSPTVDAQIEFDRDINTKTPSIVAGQNLDVTLNTKEIHHKTVAGSGKLNIFLFW